MPFLPGCVAHACALRCDGSSLCFGQGGEQSVKTLIFENRNRLITVISQTIDYLILDSDRRSPNNTKICVVISGRSGHHVNDGATDETQEDRDHR